MVLAGGGVEALAVAVKTIEAIMTQLMIFFIL